MNFIKTCFTILAFVVLGSNFAVAQLESTDLDYKTLMEEYNAVKDQTVILSILGVNCPNCRGHRDQIRDQIMKDCKNKDLRWFVVWFENTDHPASRSDAVTQAAEISDSRVKQWWFKEHSSVTPKNDSICHKFGEALWLGCKYPWDISILFRKGVEWKTNDAPFPAYCMSRTSCCNIYNITKFKDELEKKNGCDSATSAVTELKNGVNKALEISPNPADNLVNVSWDNSLDANAIEVYSSKGELVYEHKTAGNNAFSHNIELTDLRSGVYFVQLHTSSGILNRKLVIGH